MQCKAKSKRTGNRCLRPAMNDKEVCYHHGGRTPRGMASPHFKTGRYSKFLPDRMASRFEEGQADTELLALRHEISVLDARTEDLLKRVDSGESGELWRQLRDVQKELHRARVIDDRTAIAQAVTDEQPLF